MISRMITCLTTAHSIYTEPRFTERVSGLRCLKFTEVKPFLSSTLGIELDLQDELELAITISTIQRATSCPDHRIFEFAHVLYHLAQEADEAQPNHTRR